MPNLPPALSLTAAIREASPAIAAALRGASLTALAAAHPGLPAGSAEVFLSVSDLQERYGIARATAWVWTKESDFPRPIRLSGKCTRWRLSDLLAWEAARAAA